MTVVLVDELNYCTGSYEVEKHQRLETIDIKSCIMYVVSMFEATNSTTTLLNDFNDKVPSVAQCKPLTSAVGKLPFPFVFFCSVPAIVSRPTTEQRSRQVGLFNFHLNVLDRGRENVKPFLRSIVKHSESVANDGVIIRFLL